MTDGDGEAFLTTHAPTGVTGVKLSYVTYKVIEFNMRQDNDLIKRRHVDFYCSVHSVQQRCTFVMISEVMRQDLTGDRTMS